MLSNRHTQMDRQDNYSNPRCTCAPRVNYAPSVWLYYRANLVDNLPSLSNTTISTPAGSSDILWCKSGVLWSLPKNFPFGSSSKSFVILIFTHCLLSHESKVNDLFNTSEKFEQSEWEQLHLSKIGQY